MTPASSAKWGKESFQEASKNGHPLSLCVFQSRKEEALRFTPWPLLRDSRLAPAVDWFRL